MIKKNIYLAMPDMVLQIYPLRQQGLLLVARVSFCQVVNKNNDINTSAAERIKMCFCKLTDGFL
ncbi:MAG: hypothetical protein NTV71_03070 [Candidatus Omnitrophica bacterium]|nr:hypothetical protein [Candidatus Omnitrophota bacterium]